MLINTALIGNGYWANVLKKYITSIFHLRYIANSRFNREVIWNDPSIDTVFIVTPIDTHYILAKEALLHNKHVFVEKPITTDVKQAYELNKIAKDRGLVIVTDYTYTFSPNLIKKATENIKYVEITLYRNNPIKYTNVSIHWVLSSHALSIVNMFMPIKQAKFYNPKPMVGTVVGNNFKIFTSLVSIEKVTEIIVADETVVHTVPIENDNLKRAVDFFFKSVHIDKKSNIDLAINITKVITKSETKRIF